MKPTKYQRWWMEKMLDGSIISAPFDQFVINNMPIDNRSVMVVMGKKWIDLVVKGEFKLTPAGRRALETT